VLRALSLCTCCRQYPGAAAGLRLRSSHPAVSAFPEVAVGSACTSTFSGLARRSLALRPAHSRRYLYVTCYTEGFSHFVTSMTAPVASGWSDLAGWGLHPLESAALSRRTRRADIRSRAALRLDLTPSTPSSRGFDRCQARIAQARTGHLRESRVAPIPTVGQWQLGSRVTGLEEEKGQAKRSMRPELSRPRGPSPLTCCQSCGATEREPARHLIPKPRWGQSFYTPRSRNVAPHLELPS
jgi:hypothetical protein